MRNNRREFLKLAGVTGMGLAGVNILPGQAGLHPVSTNLVNNFPAPELAPLNRFSRMVQEHFVNQVQAIENTANQQRAALKTKADAEAYVQQVREKIQRSFGPWPPKTPLKARVTGILKRDGYNIEKLIYESRPGFPVTANLYVPQNRKLPLPAVLGTCGHGDAGKAMGVYQSFAQGLARQGYVVLIIDPIGQGERVQFLSPDLKPRHGIGVPEHNYGGNQMLLTGESLGSWFTWDCIRGVDYLISRREVDPKHIGVTGNSGGGTQATWLCGVEPRLTMAAPSCFVVGFGRNLANELPADLEQCPPGVLSLGLDHSDFIAAMAPKPVILLGQEKDFFDARGAEEMYSRLKKLYKLLGAEDNIQLFLGPEYHGYSQHNREAMYGWFNKVTKQSDAQTEPALTLEKEADLWCTPRGQVGATNPKNIFSFTKQLSQSFKKKRPALSNDDLKKEVQATLKIPAHTGTPDYRILRPVANRQYPRKFAGIYAVQTEPGIFALVYRLHDASLLSRPPAGAKRAILYLSHHSADQELRQEPLLTELIKEEPDTPIFAADVRGIGESKPVTCGDDFLAPYGNDYFYAAHSLMLNYPYAGQKTFDILRVIDWLTSFCHTDIHLVAKGWGAIPATFAALLSDPITQVTLKNALTSYADIAENEEYNWPLSTLVPGVLKTFDLPDCYRVLAAKKLRQLEPWSAMAGKTS